MEMSSNCWASAKSSVIVVSSSPKAVIVFFSLLLVGGGILSACWLDTIPFISSKIHIFNSTFPQSHNSSNPNPNPNPNPVINFQICPKNISEKPTCPSRPISTSPTTTPPTPPATCPSYFRWIHEDLRPWASTGITRETLEGSMPKAVFRLIVVSGRAYLHKYHPAYQSRDVFTLWGFLQLLRRYPGQVPDFELLFNCRDRPVMRPHPSSNFAPPPLFKYCKDNRTVDIVWPDWSFWGWPESNIKPWATLIGEMDEGNKRIPWESRDPHAFWKGNAVVVPTRRDLMKCNATKEHDWNALLYAQDWAKEAERGFNTSDLASQCTHRFKIYIEGRGWSVSEKYILACDSPTLLVDTRFIDFFTRGLMPGRHYLPIPDDDKCRSIKAAVDWGNAHPDEAQAIGRAGSRYILDELDMDHVYDYMLHLLTEYSKLLRFRPAVPENATLLCLEYFACQAEGRAREYMVESMVTAPRDSEPCAMPPPFGPGELEGLLEMKAKATAQAEKWK